MKRADFWLSKGTPVTEGQDGQGTLTHPFLAVDKLGFPTTDGTPMYGTFIRPSPAIDMRWMRASAMAAE